MKNNIFAIMMAFIVSISLGGFSGEVEAKKFGGGKSFGKSYNIPKSTSPTSNAATTNKGNGLFGGGMMGGLMGGLLAGGLFAALMSGGAFDGLAFGDILLFALVGFLVYKFFIAPRRQQAMANQAGYQRQMHGDAEQGITSSFFGRPAIQLPPDFQQEAFLAEAKQHYTALQRAWDENNFAEIQEYVSAELLELLQAEREQLGPNKAATEVLSVSAELVRGEIIDSIASITLLFSAAIKEDEVAVDSRELWHLEKDMDIDRANWIIVGIQQES